METVKEIKRLRENANQIYDLFLNKIPRWAKDRKHFDKVGWGFNQDDRFNACETFYVAFSSHMGTYGDSGCSRQCSLDKELFRKHFIKYLNDNKETIMLAIAKQIEDEAKSLKSKAENELQISLQQLSELDNL